MKLSCLPVSFFDEIIRGSLSVEEWAKIGIDLKLDAIDLSILFIRNYSFDEIMDLRKKIETLGTQIAMITSYPDLTHPDPAQRERELELEIEVIKIAERLGVEMVRVTAGQAHPETVIKNGIEWAVEGLCKLVDNTKKTGVILVYENHAKPGVWRYTDFSQPPEIFLEIVERTADLGLGINFDTGNAAAFSKDPVKFLNSFIHRVVSVHASDTESYGYLKHVLLGTGITPFKAIFDQLKMYGWDNWICMEEGSFQGKVGIKKAADFIRRIWSEAGVK